MKLSIIKKIIKSLIVIALFIYVVSIFVSQQKCLIAMLLKKNNIPMK